MTRRLADRSEVDEVEEGNENAGSVALGDGDIPRDMAKGSLRDCSKSCSEEDANLSFHI